MEIIARKLLRVNHKNGSIKTADYLMVKYDTKRICVMILPVDPENRKTFDDGINSKLPDGAEPTKPAAAVPTIRQINVKQDEDLRVRIRVPGNYIRPSTQGSLLQELKDGIIFPYTPQISYDYKAEYKNMNAVHSNYSQYFYTNSSVSPIQISGKFTVQSDKDAAVWLSTKHLLAALTKMPYADDPAAGAPPPVCRLFAYGEYMFKGVPIVISNFRIELPADIDYYSVGSNSSTKFSLEEEPPANTLGVDELSELIPTRTTTTYPSFVPTVSTFQITCYPIYSRREMLQSSLKNFLEDYRNNTKYL